MADLRWNPGTTEHTNAQNRVERRTDRDATVTRRVLWEQSGGITLNYVTSSLTAEQNHLSGFD